MHDTPDLIVDIELCPRCGCCELEFEECAACGGAGEYDAYEEDPLWYQPGDTEPCSQCDGKGGWKVCSGRCDEHGQHNRQ